MGGKPRVMPSVTPRNRGGRPRKYPAQATAFNVWFRNSGISPQEIAAAIGCAVPTVYNLANGYHLPALRLALAIERFTDGAVPVQSWGV